jgi:hypothetical protein
MNCELARERLVGFIDEQLRADESAALRRHIEKCAGCFGEYEYQARLNSPLRELRPAAPPEGLAMQIRLRASSTCTLSFWERWRVRLSDLMRPFALPAAGGLLAALILFAIMIPAVSVTHAAGFSNDVPTVLSTEPRFKQPSLLPALNQDLLVECWIDSQGRVSNYQVFNEQGSPVSQQAAGYRVGDVMLTTLFQPATRFGQPTVGKILVSLRRINIKG